MYQLVKGRETVRERSPAARKPQSPEPVTRPIQPWVDPDPIRRSWIERFGLVAAGLALIVLVDRDGLMERERSRPRGPAVQRRRQIRDSGAGARRSRLRRRGEPMHAMMPAAPEEVDLAPAAEAACARHGKVRGCRGGRLGRRSEAQGSSASQGVQDRGFRHRRRGAGVRQTAGRFVGPGRGRSAASSAIQRRSEGMGPPDGADPGEPV